MSIRTTIAAMTIAAAAVTATAPAHARDFAPRSMTVSYADLNMSTDAGRTTLDGRIRRAAKTVCGWTGQDLASQRADRTCRVTAIADAEAQMPTVIAGNAGGTLAVRAR